MSNFSPKSKEVRQPLKRLYRILFDLKFKSVMRESSHTQISFAKVLEKTFAITDVYLIDALKFVWNEINHTCVNSDEVDNILEGLMEMSTRKCDWHNAVDLMKKEGMLRKLINQKTYKGRYDKERKPAPTPVYLPPQDTKPMLLKRTVTRQTEPQPTRIGIWCSELNPGSIDMTQYQAVTSGFIHNDYKNVCGPSLKQTRKVMLARGWSQKWIGNGIVPNTDMVWVNPTTNTAKQFRIHTGLETSVVYTPNMPKPRAKLAPQSKSFAHLFS